MFLSPSDAPVQSKSDGVVLQQWTAVMDILDLIGQIVAIKYLKIEHRTIFTRVMAEPGIPGVNQLSY